MFNHSAYQKVLETIQLHALQPSTKLVAVTKTVAAEHVLAAYQAGITNIGENRVQSALEKQAQLSEYPLNWHFIGPLQRNKINASLGRFSLIHSIDTLALAQALSSRHHAAFPNTPQPVLLQVNLTQEPQKHGFSAESLRQSFDLLQALPGLSIQGLMTMARHQAPEREIALVFEQAQQLKQQLESTWQVSLPELSMGMSDDYLIALQHGATLVRVGSLLFSP